VACPRGGRIVTIELGDSTVRVIDSNGELLTTVRRNSTGETLTFGGTWLHMSDGPNADQPTMFTPFRDHFRR
jgi:hypothetical protein